MARWTDQSSDELGFVVEFFVNGAFEPYDEAPANSTRYVTPPGFSLQSGTSYSFRLFAYNDFGESVAAGPAQATTLTSNPDADADGVTDALDDCTNVPNGSQLDADGDGYGNACDADLNNSGLVTATDFNLLRSVLNQSAGASALAGAADINGSGLVTSTDFNLLRSRLNSAPGPSGLH